MEEGMFSTITSSFDIITDSVLFFLQQIEHTYSLSFPYTVAIFFLNLLLILLILAKLKSFFSKPKPTLLYGKSESKNEFFEVSACMKCRDWCRCIDRLMDWRKLLVWRVKRLECARKQIWRCWGK
eukprot:TRINITY_DN5113_c0_g2_i1.p2 TRINITY_DN5113_c0_g2~~TRINITY_DN5113_c0_g2_i1.p2  ORF type:complete len:125 (+),score=23.60 TRINITY_DN5113_c0_g2_i1:154-528(+)